MYQNRIRAAVAAVITILVALSFFVAVQAASAHLDHSITRAGAAATYGHDIGRRHVKPRKVRVTTPTSNPTPTQPTPTHTPQYVEADDQNCTPQNVVAFLQAHQATILRMVLTPVHAAAQDGLACIQAARADGYKIYLSLAYDSAASPTQVAAYVTQTLQTYGPAWAVALGNEQTLSNDYLNEVSSTPSMYFEMWQAVEPTIAADDPGAIRVLADASPWDSDWLANLVARDPVGAQAAAYHCYNTQHGGLQVVPQLAAAMKADGLPLWCSEMAPNTIPYAVNFLNLQTASQYDTDVTQTIGESPDVQLESYYSWPEIGAA